MLPPVPCGELGDGAVFVVPLVVPVEASGDPVEPPPGAPLPDDADPTPVEPPDVELLSPVLEGVEPGPAIDELPVVDVLDGFDIELSVFG